MPTIRQVIYDASTAPAGSTIRTHLANLGAGETTVVIASEVTAQSPKEVSFGAPDPISVVDSNNILITTNTISVSRSPEVLL